MKKMNIKPKATLSALTVLWVFVVILEGIASVIRFWYSRKMHIVAKVFSGLVNAARTVLMVILAISNVMLFMRHVDDER